MRYQYMCTSGVVSNHMHKIIIINHQLSKKSICVSQNENSVKIFPEVIKGGLERLRAPRTGADPIRARLRKLGECYAL